MTPTSGSSERREERESRLDRAGMRALIAGFPDQLADAVERTAGFASDLSVSRGAPAAIAVLGMGGSAVGGDLVRAYTRPLRRRPLVVVRDYDLPGWLDDRAVAIVSSYSGNTEETLSAAREAGARGIPVVAVTTGGRLAELAAASGSPVLTLPMGFPPRAALAYSFAACALITARLDPGLDVGVERDALAVSADALRGRAEEWLSWDRANPALAVAESASRRLAVIAGGHPVSVAAAGRWKAQLNENGKVPAYVTALPEHNHNEIVGLEGEHASLGGTVAIWLETPHDDRGVSERFAFLRHFAEGRVGAQHRIVAGGETPLETMLWLCHLGDCASFLASVIVGRDPTPVASIDRLKSALTPRPEGS